jgi:hypothetical protein
MLTTIIFFIAGLVIGLISLRLLNMWEVRGTGERESNKIFRHHS